MCKQAIFLHSYTGTKLKLPQREGGTKGREGGREGEEEGRRGDTHTLVNYFLQVERQQLLMWREWATAWQVSRLLGW